MNNQKEICLYYNIIYKTIRQNTRVEIPQLCNGYNIVNVGATQALVEDFPLNAGTPGTNNGEGLTIGGNKGEIFSGRLDVTFPSGAGIVSIQFKIYLPNQSALNEF